MGRLTQSCNSYVLYHVQMFIYGCQTSKLFQYVILWSTFGSLPAIEYWDEENKADKSDIFVNWTLRTICHPRIIIILSLLSLYEKILSFMIYFSWFAFVPYKCSCWLRAWQDKTARVNGRFQMYRHYIIVITNRRRAVIRWYIMYMPAPHMRLWPTMNYGIQIQNVVINPAIELM